MLRLFKTEMVNKIQIGYFNTIKEYLILEVILVKCLLSILRVFLLKFPLLLHLIQNGILFSDIQEGFIIF